MKITLSDTIKYRAWTKQLQDIMDNEIQPEKERRNKIAIKKILEAIEPVKIAKLKVKKTLEIGTSRQRFFALRELYLAEKKMYEVYERVSPLRYKAINL